MLSGAMQAFMLNVIVLSVVAPIKQQKKQLPTLTIITEVISENVALCNAAKKCCWTKMYFLKFAESLKLKCFKLHFSLL